jgi:hypothetical protein
MHFADYHNSLSIHSYNIQHNMQNYRYYSKAVVVVGLLAVVAVALVAVALVAVAWVAVTVVTVYNYPHLKDHRI